MKWVYDISLLENLIFTQCYDFECSLSMLAWGYPILQMINSTSWNFDEAFYEFCGIFWAYTGFGSPCSLNGIL